MHRLFILPLKSLPLKLGAFALSALFILAACGGAPISFDINLNGLDSQCIANPFLKGCDKHGNSIKTYRQLIIKDCTDNPSKSSTDLCIAAEGATNPPSDNENGAVVEEVVDNTPKDIEIKPELDKDSSTKTDKEKGETTSLEIVDLCSDPANANNERCSPAVINCINNPFSGSCQGDNLLGNFVRGGVTVSKTVVLQDKRAVDCRDGNIDRAQCQTLNSEKQRCTGAAFSDASCSAVAYSVCKADAFDPLCGEKENFAGVYFNERSEVCFEDPNNPNCTGLNGHVAVVCSEYPFDRLCTGNADYDDARANACDADPTISASCPVAPVPEVADVCLDNPFGPTCADSDYNNARKDLAKTCAIQAVTGAVTSACSTIIAEALPCFINPFDTVCDSNPAVRSYIAQLRSTRVAFCKNSTGLFDHLIAPLCTGAPVAKSVCRIDPFDTVCLGDSAYAGDRLSACRDDSSNQRCSNIIAGVCRNNPFDPLCGSGYNDDRANFCRNSVEPLYRCLKVEDRVCATNPLDSLCSSSIYADARINACRNDQSNPSCRTIIANLCHRDNNPFDSLCGSSYDGIRESVCASNPNSSRCSDTLTRVCGGNPFDRLCRNTQSYLDARVSICRGNPADGRCSWTIGSICRDDPFDSLCGGGYNNARETACRNGSNNTQCGNVIAGVCSGNPFDPLCGNGYTGERETACRNGSNNTQCGNIVAGVCSGNPFDPLCGSGYTQNRRSLCTDDPFTPRCAGDVYNDLRVSFCEDNVGTHPECPAPTPQVTAALWENSFDEELASAANGRDHGGKFLKGRAADLDNGGLREFDANHVGTLTFANATFNGRPLGGDATDGTAVFVTERSPYGTPSYAAILSGTNLGAPLTQTEGTAQWIGAFQYSGSGDHDFILTVTFGGTDKAGSISAFVKGYREVTHNKDFLVEGDFDNAGLITGTVRLRHFYDDYYTDNRPNTRYLNTVDTSKLTGLIGEEGAVGVFTGDFSSSPVIGFSGGFVARPASEQELTEVAETCVDDPFKSACSVGYEDERHAVVELCITGDNALNEELCGSANEWYSCIKNPFDSYCSSSFAKYNRPARVNRVAFCRNADNADNALCTDEDAYSYICRIYPFDAQCLGDSDYDQTRQDACTIAGAGSTQCRLLAGLTCGSNPFSSYCDSGYNDARTSACRNGSTNTQCGGIIAGVCGGNPFDPLCGSGYTQSRRSLCTDNPFAPRCAGDTYNDLRVSFCENNAGTHPSCPAPTPQVTAKVWADSFDEDLAHGATAEDTDSKFLIGRETDLDSGGVDVLFGLANNYLPNYLGNLNLADATFNRVALGGDRADGMAFFASERAPDGTYRSYAGILEGTNLGAPLTDTAGSAKWIGSFKFQGWAAKDFVLNISFGTGDGVGEIEALVQPHLSYFANLFDVHITGEFDDTGVITGTARYGLFRTNVPDNRGFALPAFTGKLTGLIGEEGAVGAFFINDHFGGFVARPSSEAELRTLEQTCASDPFNALCTVGYEAERVARVEECIIGGNPDNPSLCWNAMRLNSCIGNPFADKCRDEFADYYQQARDNRVTFCRTTGNADHHLCADGYADVYICTNHPFDAQCLGNNDYTSLRRDACTDNPFAPRCAGEGYNDLRVSFCEGKVGTHSSCPTPEPTTPQVTASVWADSFDEPLATEASSDERGGRFLIGRETDLDASRVRNAYRRNPYYLNNLNLADATFNGVALGGDRADGVAFASNVRAIYNNVLGTYAGVLSGTNLGAPLTDTIGSAKWIGSFQIMVGPSGGRAVEDFVLNISFGAGDGAGEIEALIQNDLHYPSDHHITGEFDDAGVITGTVQHGYYRTNDADNRGRAWRTGKLTGLIGEEGAVGAFLMPNYYGGFVARPSSAAELRTLEQTCGDDPYNPLCTIGYESERLELIEHCITDDNVNDERCVSVNKLTHCIKNPFRSDCEESLPQHHELVLANRIAFCRKAENVDNALCTYSYAIQYICTRHPFSPQCFADSRYNQARQNACTTAGTGSTQCRLLAGLNCGTNPFHYYCDSGYNDARASACRNGSTNTQCGGIISGICSGNPFDLLCGSGYTQNRRNACSGDPFATRCAGEEYNDLRVSFCERNASNPACPTPEPTTPQVTAKVWADSFDEDLAHAPTAEDTESKFLIGRATDLDTGGRSPYWNSPNRSGNLNLADATFNGVALGGDRADGVAFFGAERANNGKLYSYVGILEGTNLGAPLTDTEGSAKWIGAFQAEGHSPVDFVLKVSFGTGAGAGEIEAIVERQNSFYQEIDITGEFDDAGVITGTVRQSPNNRRRHHTTGKLTGLIGQEGAIGAFVINNGRSYDYFGVFVARPSSAEELRTVEQICTDDPFIPLCATSYEAERNAIIEHCIIGDNANDEERCGSADEWYPCIVVPFGWKCDEMNYNVSQYHEQVRTNRVAFCLTPGNADNRLCTFARHHICTNYPFDAQCIDRDYYAQFRRAACADAPFAPRCAGEGYNDLRLSFCRRNAGNPACPPPPEPEIQHASGHVTATVWTDSFDEGELAAKASRTDTVSKFLKGRSGDLDTGGIGLLAGGNVNYSGTLTLAGTYNNGDSMDGDAADGIAFFAADQVNGRFLSYAGILSGTDLGAPVTQTQGTAQWLGSFQYEGYSATDFTLNILFGSGDEAGLINTIIKDYASNDFHVAGSFDDTGVITGNVYLGTFNVNQDPITQGTIKHTAELTGLIGQQGVVGAFVGHTSSTTGFAGGFVAAPGTEGRTVSTADWLASFDTEPFSIPIDTKNQFLKATAYGFNLAEMQGFSRTRQQLAVLTLADNTADGTSLGGHAADGVAFFGKTITSENNNRYYSGILANTDLGLPLEPEGTPIYEWKGVFQAIGVNALKTDFTLTVTYTGGNYAGEIEAFINRSGNYYYHIQGNFNHGGVIVNGTADYGQYTDGDRDDPIARKRQTGVLSGLIGQEGAIGAFITTGGGIGGYYYSSGGFVAVPNRPDLPTSAPDTTTNRVTTEDWVASFETAPSIAPTDYRHQFVQGSETGLYTGNISVGRKWLSGPRRFYTETIDSVIFDDVRVDSDATGGFSFFQGTNGVWFYNYAGILAGTDLGAPLTQTTGSARWNGVFTSKDASYGYKKRDFVLRITFGGQEHAGTLNGYVQKDRFGEHYLVEGYFDDNGVIGGTVAEWFKGSYTPNIARLENNNQHNSKLTGLIGSRGAVAAFTGKRFVGGFIASPDIELSSEVTERDWRESFNDKVLTLDGTRDDVGLSAFIQDGDQNRIAAATPKGVLTINGVPNTNDDEVGVKFFAVMMDGRSRHYAGIFINTRLGNPLTVLPAVNGNPVTATWNGQLGIVANNSGVTIRDMNLSVDFTNQTISHSSVLNTGLKSISLDGTWNDNGLINGTITYDPNPVLNAVNARDGVVRGLIGEYGAVGAFISNDDVTDTPFAGGFVATPPSE